MANFADYTAWRSSIFGTQPDWNSDEGICGFWRISAAKTKPDYPCAIWRQDDGQRGTVRVVAIGRQQPFPEGSDLWHDFIAGTWPKCSAVTKAAYDAALEQGVWGSDGKASRKPDVETAAVEGGNNPPVEEQIEDQIAALAELLATVGEPSDQAEADKITGMQDRMRGLIRRAETEQEIEYRPLKAAADDVSIKWRRIKAPGEDALTKSENKRKAWLKKEQAKIDSAVAAENKRIREENERLLRDAADAALAPEIEPKRARAGTAFGRQSGLRKVTVGKITDWPKYLIAISEHKELRELAQTIANRAAKVGLTIDGMEAAEEWQ